MAGEWIAYDLALPDKPEVQELIDLTDEPVEAVVFNLLRLWGWASMHCADGTARMTLPRLVRTCGANEEFWRAVASVGWLEIDETAATVAVPGWDRRFSQAAKSRAQHADRSREFEDRNPGRKKSPPLENPGKRQKIPPGEPSGAQAPDVPALKRRRGEEIRNPPPPPRSDAWESLRAAWNAGCGRPWKPATAPDGFDERLAEAGWLDQALAAIEALPACKFFRTPPTLIQFCKPGFVTRVLGGQYDAAKAQPASATPRDDRPPPRVWSGSDEAARVATLKKLREAVG
jgi:hypothetical protein